MCHLLLIVDGFALVLWHINHCRLFNAKSCFELFEKSIYNVTNSDNPSNFKCSCKKTSRWHLFVDFSKTFDSIYRGKMEKMLIVYGLPRETIIAIMMLNKNTKVKFCSLDGNTEFFDTIAGMLQGKTLAPYLFIICLDSIVRTLIDFMKDNGFTLEKARSRRCPTQTIMDADYADDIELLANTPTHVFLCLAA